MTDTPRSERSQTRFSTPVSELDDHRHQPVSLVRADASPSRSRRPTFASSYQPERSDLVMQANTTLDGDSITRRDFESAVVDDDQLLSPGQRDRRLSGTHSPRPRRDTFRRPRDPTMERPSKSRGSSSSRSTSPPNSVDAFAAPRRRDRANTTNTIQSRAGSEHDPGLHRTHSIGTTRRGTVTGEHVDHANDADGASTHSSAEEDVCFPVLEDPGKTTRFDYEELEEFMAENRTKTAIARPLRHKASVVSRASIKPKVFSDLRPKACDAGGTRMKSDCASLKSLDAASQEKLKEQGLAHVLNDVKNVPEVKLNRWTFFSSELDDTIHAAELEGLLMPGESFRDLFEPQRDEGVFWLDMAYPTEEEVFAICKAFGVHPLTREDICLQEPREKVELFHQYYFVAFRSFYQANKDDEDYLEPVNFYAVVFKEGLLTFTFSESPHTLNVRKRISRLRDYINLNADWICYALIDDIVDSFAPVIRDIEQEADSIEDQVFTARLEDSRIILKSIGDCRKKVMQLLRLLGGKADVIKGFAKRCNESYSVAPRGDVGLYLSDIQDHVVTMMSNLSHFEKMLSRAHSNYLAQISVDQVNQGNASNGTLQKVTVIATILVPLNLICGLFGMNVRIPGQDASHGSFGWFFGILGSIGVFIVVCLAVARRLRYI